MNTNTCYALPGAWKIGLSTAVKGQAILLCKLTPNRAFLQEYYFQCSVALSHVRHFASPWTVALQAPLSMDFPGKNTGLSCHFLHQGIFLTQGSKLHLLCVLYHRQILYSWAIWEALLLLTKHSLKPLRPQHVQGSLSDHWQQPLALLGVFLKCISLFWHQPREDTSKNYLLPENTVSWTREQQQQFLVYCPWLI